MLKSGGKSVRYAPAVSTGRRNTLSKTHIVEYMSKNQRDRCSLAGVKNAELWEGWQRGCNESLNRLSRLSFPRKPTYQGIGKLTSMTTAHELNGRQKSSWNPKPWQSDLPQVLHRPVEIAVVSCRSARRSSYCGDSSISSAASTGRSGKSDDIR